MGSWRGGSGGAIRLIGKNVTNRGLVRVDGGNRGAGGGRVMIASNGSIERGVLSIGSGSFKEVSPPTYRYQISFSFPTCCQPPLRRKLKSQRPQNLTAYFPMDEAQGLSTEEMKSGKFANLIGGTTWTDGVIGSALQFNGSNGYLTTDLTGEVLGVDGKKSRTISFWVKVEGVTANDPGFYGYGSLLNSDGANQYWSIRNISNTNFTRFREHWGGVHGLLMEAVYCHPTGFICSHL